MDIQINSIEASMEQSKSRAPIDLLRSNLFKDILRNVSKKALSIMKVERGRCKDEKGIDASSCGCYYRRTHGLPCSHEIAFTKRAGRRIGLDDIHPFWRKLDLDPEKCIEAPNNSNVGPSIEDMQRLFERAPPALQRQVLDTLHTGLHPDEQYVEEPAHLNKANKARASCSRLPSDWERTAHHFGISTTRSSGSRKSRNSFMAHTQSELMSLGSNSLHTPPRQKTDVSGASPDTGTPTSRAPSGNRRGRGSSSERGRGRGSLQCSTTEFHTSRYSGLLLPFIVPYIGGYTDVAMDGNCGFRCVALAIYGDENDWPTVRRDCCRSLTTHRTIYERVIPWVSFEELHRRLAHFHGSCSEDHWMSLPEVGHIVATCYNVVFLSYSNSGAVTCFPVTDPDGRGPPVKTIVLGHVNMCHFISVRRHISIGNFHSYCIT